MMIQRGASHNKTLRVLAYQSFYSAEVTSPKTDGGVSSDARRERLGVSVSRCSVTTDHLKASWRQEHLGVSAAHFSVTTDHLLNASQTIYCCDVSVCE